MKINRWYLNKIRCEKNGTLTFVKPFFSQGKVDQSKSDLSLKSRTPFIHIFPQEHVEENAKPNVTITSALMSSPYLMLVILNAEWLAWTIETPPKVLLHDQEITG